MRFNSTELPAAIGGDKTHASANARVVNVDPIMKMQCLTVLRKF